ncbi:MAG: hypothetical protein ABEJ72_10555, partial [Candidatus Aenigmatarchaeota archaeon]
TSEDGHAYSIVMKNSSDSDRARELIQEVHDNFEEISEHASRKKDVRDHLGKAIEFEKSEVLEEKYDPFLMGVSELVGPVFNGNVERLKDGEDFIQRVKEEYDEDTSKITSEILEEMDMDKEDRLQEFGRSLKQVRKKGLH